MASSGSAKEALGAITLRLPAPLVDLFPGAPRRLEIQATTVKEAIAALDSQWPGMRDRICDSTPAIRKHINVFIDGERAMLDTKLTPGSEVFILTAISGG